ncbi:type III-B CRISPR module-associated protein Cmr3 [Palaeococcus sp. (in: euryarchaeotes)]
MIKIIMDPYDVLLFRESKPFVAGDDHIARSTLPNPQTVAGAIRSYIYLSQNKSQKAGDCIGYGKEEPEFEVTGVFLSKNGEELFPIPLNCTKEEKKLIVNYPGKFRDKLILIPRGKPEHVLIRKRDLMRFLNGKLKGIPKKGLITPGEFREKRVGIKLTDKRVTEERMLYSVEFLRVEGIVAWINDSNGCIKEFLKNEGVLSLGGERRFAKFEICEEDEELMKRKVKGRKVLLYFATPVVIGDGKSPRELILDSINGKLRGFLFVTTRPMTFSGWDYAKKKPKGTKYAIPAGSVAFLEFKGEVELGPMKIGELKKLGFGLVLPGVWE